MKKYNRAEAMSKELLFEDAIRNAISSEKAYLGDRNVVESIFRLAVGEVFSVIPDLEKAEDLIPLIESVGKKYMRIFLGSDSNYASVPGWNKPGAIDTFVSKWCGVEADTPTKRLVGAFAGLISDLMDVEEYARKDDTLEEQWQGQVDAVLEKYILIFMGVSLPAQMV